MDDKDKKEKKAKPATVQITNHNEFQKGVGAFVTNLEHLTIVMDEDGNMKVDTGQVPVMPHTQVDIVGEKKQAAQKKERKEKLCFMVHPAVSSEEEIWAIHDEIKRLVTNQGIQDICKYLNRMENEKRILQPMSGDAAYNELVRMGMPDTDGFSLKTFMKYYKK